MKRLLAPNENFLAPNENFWRSAKYSLINSLNKVLPYYPSPKSNISISKSTTGNTNSFTNPTSPLQTRAFQHRPFLLKHKRHLADLALSLSARRAHETSTYASEISSKNTKHVSVQNVNYAFQDCMVKMADSVERLSRSIRQLRKLGRADMPSFKVRLDNVLTWASAALTDQSMCVGSLTESGAIGSNAHAILRRKVVEVSKIIL